jgi:hypothetical protein
MIAGTVIRVDTGAATVPLTRTPPPAAPPPQAAVTGKQAKTGGVCHASSESRFGHDAIGGRQPAVTGRRPAAAQRPTRPATGRRRDFNRASSIGETL